MASPDNNPKTPEDRKVPDDLLQKLHQANLRFHAAKQQLESAMADSEFRHLERVGQAEEEVRQAEREVEQVTIEIHGTLKPPPAAEPEA